MSTPPETAARDGVEPIASADGARRVLDDVERAPLRRPFADGTLDFLQALSDALLHDRDVTRRFPDAAAFGYWIRRSNVERLRERFATIEREEGGVRVPRGLSFHVAPGNVEALFAYSWTVSALAGCSAVVKLSSRATDLSQHVAATIADLTRGSELADAFRFVSYDRGRTELTSAFTRAADVLAFWGGDQAIDDLRRHPIKPSAPVVTFPDRESLLLIRTAAYAAMEDGDRDAFARRAATDVFSFGQAACSSPRFVVWVDDEPADDRESLARDLYTRIGANDALLADITPTEIMAKRTYLYEVAARGGVEEVHWTDPQWLVLRPAADDVRAVEHPALGTLVEVRRDRLADVTSVLRGSDQTITYLGFSTEELRDWVAASLGPWPKRLRPVGQAVDFDARWDGMDLLSQFTSLTTVD